MAGTSGMLDVKKFFEPIELKEFKEFWASLSDEEKESFKRQALEAEND